MRLERREGYWLLIDGPVPRGAAAITIGPVISIRARSAGSTRLLRHEAEHVAQWRRYGFLGFLLRYVPPYLRWRAFGYPHWGAYRRIPFEVQAEWTARREEWTARPDAAVG